MAVLVATVVVGLLAALVAHAGTGRRGRYRLNHLPAANPANASYQPIPATAPIADLRLDENVFAAVGLRLETDRARAFVASLAHTALVERSHGGAWTYRTVDRVARTAPIDHLVGITADLGLGTLVVAPGTTTAEAESALRSLLIHVLGVPLQDALRLAAGQRSFWLKHDLVDPRYQEALQDAA